MANIVYRSSTLPGPNAASVNKGSPLLNTEVDGNFRGLNDELATKAPLASPALTGTPTAPTAAAATNTTQLATTAFVHAERTNTATLTNKTLTNPTINAGSGTIVLPASTAPSQTAEGSIVWDSDDDLVTVGTGTARKTLVDTDSTQNLTNKTVNRLTITAPATSATLTIANGKTFTLNNTLTFTGTDASSVAFGAGGTVAYTANKLNAFAATTSAELAGVISDETGSGSLVFATSPVITTPTFNTNATTPILYGSSSASGNLNLESTSNATKGEVRLGGTGDAVKLNTTTAGFVKTNSSGVFSIDTTQYYYPTGTDVAVADGGTGISGTPTNGQLLIGNGTGYTLANLSQGLGITVTNGAGSVTVTNNDRGSSQNIFKNMTDGANTAVADENNDTFTFAQGGALTVVVDPVTDRVTYSHADTSSQASVDNSGNTFIQDITLDTYGHITAIVSGTATQSNDFGIFAINGTDSGYTWGTANTNTNQVADTTGDTLTFVKGGGLNFYTSTVAGTDAIKIEHADTSTVANLSSDNSGGTYIQDISFTFDTYGHVTAASVATGTESNDFGTFAINGTDSGYTWGTANSNTNQVADARGDTLTFVKGPGLNFYTNTVAGTDAIKIEHADTSSQASVNNSGNTFIQDITLDEFGHITAIVSATATESDTLAIVTGRGATTSTAISITNSTSSTSTTTGALVVTGGVGIGENLNIGGNAVITGNLTVNGTTTTVNSTTITIDDKNLELGSVTTPTNATADGGGITLKGATDKTFNWINSTAAWTSSEHLAVAAGKNIQISGATSGTATIVAPAAAGTPTLTLPTTSGTFALTSDIGNGTLSLATSGNGISGSQSFTANQSGAATFTVTSNATSANTPSTIVFRDSSGNFTAGVITATDFNSTSDATLKENISGLEGINLLEMINPVQFNWKENGKKSYGVIAQEIEKIMPELVGERPDGVKSVSYIPLIAMLIDAVKKLNKRINELEETTK